MKDDKKENESFQLDCLVNLVVLTEAAEIHRHFKKTQKLLLNPMYVYTTPIF